MVLFKGDGRGQRNEREWVLRREDTSYLGGFV